jgi:hypothetical protein
VSSVSNKGCRADTDAMPYSLAAASTTGDLQDTVEHIGSAFEATGASST